MADESGDSDIGMLAFVFGGFAVLVIFWFASGGPARTDFRGLFLKPPPPLDTGEAYGPTPGATTTPNH